MALSVAVKNSTLSIWCLYAKCRLCLTSFNVGCCDFSNYAECRYVECHYAECRGAESGDGGFTTERRLTCHIEQ